MYGFSAKSSVTPLNILRLLIRFSLVLLNGVASRFLFFSGHYPLLFFLTVHLFKKPPLFKKRRFSWMLYWKHTFEKCDERKQLLIKITCWHKQRAINIKPDCLTRKFYLLFICAKFVGKCSTNIHTSTAHCTVYLYIF